MISVETLKGKSVTEHAVEIVERKGRGHPDHICDSIMDAISVALCGEYRREFGAIFHHNIDKGLLVAGRTVKRFGGGRLVKPMELIIGDRATFGLGDAEIPVNDIAVSTAKRWFQKNLHFLDPEKHVRYRSVLAKGSEQLTDIFRRPGESRVSNDTSAALGYYPLSPTELVVLELERRLNSMEFKNRFPQTGEDTKVMALRRRRRLDITVAIPLLSRYISSEKDYFIHKKLIHQEMMRFLADQENPNPMDMVVHYNTLDVEYRGHGGVYLSLLGTSAEDADSGQVGRGNRVNGLISVNRPMGTEAAAGKNPVSHVGKIYNVLAHKIAKDVYERLEGIKEVYVLLLGSIGAPIDKPKMATAQILLERGRNIKELAPNVEEIFDRNLQNIHSFCLELAEGKHPVC
jgi:S-adenosylmethionine synthetase